MHPSFSLGITRSTTALPVGALLGIAGSWVGGFPVGALGLTGVAPGLIAAVLGAMLLLLSSTDSLGDGQVGGPD